jgi:hypothetical protein
MKSHHFASRRLLVATLPLALSCLALAACEGDDDVPVNASNDGGTNADQSAPRPDAAAPDADAAADASRPPPSFLPSVDYADYLVIDGAFPYDVTQVHTTTTPVGNGSWGHHNGPIGVSIPFDPTGKLTVYRYAIPADPKAPVSAAMTQIVTDAPGIPVMHFYNPVIDLPVGQKSLISYSGVGAAFPGEAMIYDTSLTTVEQRANVNGFYAVAAARSGAAIRMYYASLSPLVSGPSGTADNGVYVSETCNGALVATGACAPSFQLLKWAGNSGPVVLDRDGNLFVAAATATTQDVYALTRAEASSAKATVNKTKFFDFTSSGTGGLTAIAPEGNNEGWALVKGFDGAMPVDTVAVSYKANATVTDGGKARIPAALKAGPKNMGYSFYADAEGDLWVAASTMTGGVLLELRRKP